MTTVKTLADFKPAILTELPSVQDAVTRRMIHELIAYAETTEQEADNRDQRPRPDGKENAAYYRKVIDLEALPAQLADLIEHLLRYLETIESNSSA